MNWTRDSLCEYWRPWSMTHNINQFVNKTFSASTQNWTQTSETLNHSAEWRPRWSSAAESGKQRSSKFSGTCYWDAVPGQPEPGRGIVSFHHQASRRVIRNFREKKTAYSDIQTVKVENEQSRLSMFMLSECMHGLLVIIVVEKQHAAWCTVVVCTWK